MADFGKLNFAVAFNPQTAFPLDARYYFDSLTDAQTAAAGAVEAGSSDGTYYYGEQVVVVADGAATLYIIQPDGSLTEVGAASSSSSDGEYMTADDVQSAIETAIAAAGHASFVTADAVPTADAAEENVLYLVLNSDTGYYDIYALVGEEVVLLDDTGVDLTDYSTTEEMNAAITAAISAIDAPLITSVDTDEFTVTDGLLAINAVPLEKVTGLTDALSSAGEENVIELITIDGTALEITDKTVDIPLATTESAGLLSAVDKVKLDALDADEISDTITAVTELQATVNELQAAVEAVESYVTWEEL